MKINNDELIAFILVALFILAPLYCGETQIFVYTNRDTGGGQSPNSGEIIGWLTLGVLVFQAWIFSRQAGIMGEQNALMNRQAEISETQVLVAERLERALLLQSPPSFAFLGYKDSQDKSVFPEIDIGFCNHGRSPAIINHAKIVVIVSRLPPLRDATFKFWHAVAQGDLSPHVFYVNFHWPDPSVPPGEAVRTLASYQGKLRPDQIDELGTGNQKLWVDGAIFYTDVFGKSRETHFRWVYDYLMDMLIEDGGPLHNRYT
jgi:hypothetical protein